MKQEYLGFIIEPESDPWAIKYGWNYRYSHKGSNGEKFWNACTVDEAKEEIEEKYQRSWNH